MIAILTKTQNSAGHLVIHEKKSSKLNDIPARVSRSKLLDGGVYISHSGVSHGDRTLNIVALMTSTDRARLKTIHETETLIYVATSDGFFEAAISEIRQSKADTAINILINDKESD